ncbi:MAG TPA: hypothetical protein DE147_01860 [Gammaproteobacteria bacterium]|nr:hypothetical protein [Gammaproteobacteria bacterium]
MLSFRLEIAYFATLISALRAQCRKGFVDGGSVRASRWRIFWSMQIQGFTRGVCVDAVYSPVTCGRCAKNSFGCETLDD